MLIYCKYVINICIKLIIIKLGDIIFDYWKDKSGNISLDQFIQIFFYKKIIYMIIFTFDEYKGKR